MYKIEIPFPCSFPQRADPCMVVICLRLHSYVSPTMCIIDAGGGGEGKAYQARHRASRSFWFERGNLCLNRLEYVFAFQPFSTLRQGGGEGKGGR